MRFAGKEIKDECEKCGEILACELTRQGHGIGQKRTNMTKMVACQMRHKEKRNEQSY